MKKLGSVSWEGIYLIETFTIAVSVGRNAMKVSISLIRLEAIAVVTHLVRTRTPRTVESSVDIFSIDKRYMSGRN